MAITATFSTLLRDYMPYDMLFEELEKRNWLLLNIQKDQSWKGGPLQVPFIGNMGSSFAYAALPTAASIHEFDYQRGEVSTYKQLWGSMVFNQADLDQHDLKGSFLKILPDQIEMFVDFMKEITSMNLLNGNHFAKATDASDAANGNIIVDHPERFQIGQQIWWDDDDSAVSDGNTYVSTVNMETKNVYFVTARGGSTKDDLSAYTVAQNAKAYIQGADTASNVFTSLRGSLLSAANGGDAALYGKTKLNFPYLQAINVDGSAITATNITQKLFDAVTDVRQIGKGMCDTLVTSYKHLGSIMKDLEISRDYSAKDTKASVYGWTEIEVVGVKGRLKIVGIPECDDDVIYMLDMKSMKLFSNGFFERRKSPSGNEWFEVRNTTGYQYIVDLRFYGELVMHKPSSCGIIHTISY